MAKRTRAAFGRQRAVISTLLASLMFAAPAAADPAETLAKAGWQAEALPSGGLAYVCEVSSCNGPAMLFFGSRSVSDETITHLRADGDDLADVVRHELLGFDAAAARQWPFLSLAIKEVDGRFEIVVKGFYTGKDGNPSASGRADAIILVHINAGVAKAITSIAASPSAAAINLSVARGALEEGAKP